jgi:hypothetical protein
MIFRRPGQAAFCFVCLVLRKIALTIADLNQAGKSDIVVAEENQNHVVVLLAK